MSNKVGLAADLPPAGRSRGSRYVASDTNQEWVSDGVEWIEVTGGGGGGAAASVLQIESQDTGTPYPSTARLQVLLYPGDTQGVVWVPEVDGVTLDGGSAITFDELLQEVTVNEDGVYRATWTIGVTASHPTATAIELYALAATDTNRRFGRVWDTTHDLDGAGGEIHADVSGTGVAVVLAGEKIRLIAGSQAVDAGDNDDSVVLVRGGEPGTRLVLERIADAPAP